MSPTRCLNKTGLSKARLYALPRARALTIGLALCCDEPVIPSLVADLRKCTCLPVNTHALVFLSVVQQVLRLNKRINKQPWQQREHARQSARHKKHYYGQADMGYRHAYGA